eukprot:TRINITY_DN47252_c0_g1_i1.p1 TRINITY_DN47252_c0_g1~~TRINITY_DN47252_c0_g1_i1.p1  ORF type:complete len:370 (-),score=66.43 TRINITY_DN47252_c0_g1_i1:99-1208(-)
MLMAPSWRRTAGKVRNYRRARLLGYVALAVPAAQLLLPLVRCILEGSPAEQQVVAAAHPPLAFAGSSSLAAAAAAATAAPGDLRRSRREDRAPLPGRRYLRGLGGIRAADASTLRHRGGAALAAAALPSGFDDISLLQKVLAAMSAGAVASVVQAILSAVGEPIVNRVLVRRMKVVDAIREVSPAMMLDFFKTTLVTNFLKFPFFEAINACCAHLPVGGSLRGLITGIVFTTATLPVTNYRYRRSMQLDVDLANLYEAYLPTLIRDVVYGVVRNYATVWLLGFQPSWSAQEAQVLFIVVILGCLASSPFNEWRGYLLQTKGQKIPFADFFLPSNFARSTLLGAVKQGLALAAGYYLAPVAASLLQRLSR